MATDCGVSLEHEGLSSMKSRATPSTPASPAQKSGGGREASVPTGNTRVEARRLENSKSAGSRTSFCRVIRIPSVRKASSQGWQLTSPSWWPEGHLLMDQANTQGSDRSSGWHSSRWAEAIFEGRVGSYFMFLSQICHLHNDNDIATSDPLVL